MLRLFLVICGVALLPFVIALVFAFVAQVPQPSTLSSCPFVDWPAHDFVTSCTSQRELHWQFRVRNESAYVLQRCPATSYDALLFWGEDVLAYTESDDDRTRYVDCQGRVFAEQYGREIRDAMGRRLGTVDEIPSSIRDVNGTAVVSLRRTEVSRHHTQKWEHSIANSSASVLTDPRFLALLTSKYAFSENAGSFSRLDDDCNSLFWALLYAGCTIVGLLSAIFTGAVLCTRRRRPCHDFYTRAYLAAVCRLWARAWDHTNNMNRLLFR